MTVELVKSLREEIDLITQFLEEINAQSQMILPNGKNVREAAMTLAIFATMRAKMWLGQHLKYAGEANPYPLSTDPTSIVIEPEADKSAKRPIVLNGGIDMLISNVKAMRAKIQATIDAISGAQDLQMIDVREAYISLIDAKMWLGQELNHIRMYLEEESILKKPSPLNSPGSYL